MFAKIFPRFLDGLPDGGLIMCHPGFVDGELKRLDPLTTLREREYEFFMSDDFLPLLKAHNVALGRPPAAEGLEHDDGGADLDAIVEVDHVLVAQADAARRDLVTDGPGLVGAVDAVERRAEIKRARAERVVRARRP